MYNLFSFVKFASIQIYINVNLLLEVKLYIFYLLLTYFEIARIITIMI